jgi:hypothetical protein
MPQEYTPAGSPIPYTVPAYADVVDGPTAFKAFADDLSGGLAAKADSASMGFAFVNKTDFSAASSVSLNSVFSSTTANYRILISGTDTTAMWAVWRMRAGGADNSAAEYGHATWQVASNTAGTRVLANAATSWTNPWITSTGRHFNVAIDLFGPAISGPTSYSLTSYAGHTAAGSEHTVITSAGSFYGTNVFDGMTFAMTSGTGTIRVYGMKN